MAKYKITGVPTLNKFQTGGGPGDKYYKNNGEQFKKTSYGQWFVWNPTYKSWNYVDSGFYNGIDLEKNKAGFTPDDSSWETDKPKSTAPKAGTVEYYEQQKNKVLNNPLASTEQKIKATSSPLQSNVAINKALVQKKEEEDYLAQQKKLQEEQEELRRQEEQALKEVNPNFYNSETTQNVARGSGALLTKKEQDDFEAHKKDLAEKKAFLGRDYVTKNYVALSSEEKNNAMYGLKGITWDDADKLAGFVLDDVVKGGYGYALEDDLKAAFPNATAEQIKKYKDHVIKSRDEANRRIINNVSGWDLKESLRKRHYYDTPIRPEDNILRSWDPDDPNRVEMSGRMPQTAGEWGTRIADIVANPLDAIHYGMSSTEEMPMNMYEYEKAKQALGYEDGADQNTVLGAIDFASWFTGAGTVAQGVKMLRPTGEAVYNFAQDPSLASGANAALNVGFNALALSPLKPFLKLPKGSASTIVEPTSSFAAYAKLPGNREVLYGNPYLTESKSVINLPGFKLATGNVPTSGLPSIPITPAAYAKYGQKAALALPDDVTKGVLPNITQPHEVTMSPLTTMTTVTRELDTTVPLYRHEVPGYVPAESKTANEFNDWDYGPVSEMSEAEIAEAMSHPTSIRYIDQDGVERIGSFFPQHTAGKWWSSQKIGEQGAPHAVNNFVLDPVTGQYIDKANEMVHLETKVPFSKLKDYNVKNDPAALSFAGQPEKEFILPDEYKTNATVVNKSKRKPVNLDATLKDENIGAIATETTAQAEPSVAEVAQTFNRSDNELVSNIINDVRERKIGLWQSPEGQKRLQQMIDNTPTLKGQTPETMIEGIAQMENLNNFYQTELKINQDLKNEADQLDIFYSEGKISSNDYFDRASQLDQRILDSDKYLDDTEALFNKAGFYSSDANVIGIRPGAFKPGEIEKVTSHELGHFLGSFGPKKSGSTYLDEKLSGLKLIDDVSEQLTIPGLEVEGSGGYSLMGPGTGKDYLNTSLNYFLKGSNGTEKVPFVAELREDMLQQGIIKSEYDDITAKMLKDHYKNYKNTRGEKYPLRIYDIIKDKPENFKIMSDVLNRLPMIAGAALAYDELMNDQSDSNVSEAGMDDMGAIALFLGLLAKKPGAIKIPKKLRGITRNFQKFGNQAINTLRSTDIRYVKSQIKKLEKEWNQISADLGYGINEGLVQQESKLAFTTQQRNNKFRRFFKDRELKAEGVDTENPFGNPFQLPKLEEEVINKKQTLDTYNKAGDAYRITPEGIETTDASMFEGVTTTGSKPVTDLSTGQVVNAEVKLPGYHQEYKIVNGELSKTDLTIGQPIISPEYVTALKNSRTDVETKIPGAKVFGSSVLVTDAGMPHVTGDIDVIITQSDYNKNVKDKFQFVQDYGPAKQHAVYPQHGQEGTLDFNIIHEDAKGMVMPYYNPYMPDKTPMEIELFRQFYPEKFQEASLKAVTSGKPIEINMSAKDFMAGIDPQVKTVIDSYETSPFNKWGNYNANKEKHILRPDVLIAYGNPEVVAKGQEAYIKSIVGSKGTVGHQFTPEQLSDVNKNIDALLKINFQGDVLQTAQNPERMQLALNDYYINHTVFSREITAAALPGKKYTEDLIQTSLTEWFPGKGGSVNGIGLNAVQKGNPTHIMSSDNPIIGHRQLGLKLDTSDPVSYVDSLIKGTSGDYTFTSEEMKLLEDLIDKYIPEVKPQIKTDFKSRDILDFQPYQNFEKSKDFLDELSEQTGIRAIRKEEAFGTYGSANAQYASLLGKFDDVADAMMYSLKEYHASPKTFGERKRALEQKKQDSRGKTPNFQLQTKKDFEKLYSILDGGIKTAEARLMQLTDQLSALNSYKENLIARMVNKDDVLLQQVQNQIREMQYRQTQISMVEIPKLRSKAENLKQFYKIVGLGIVGLGVIGGGYAVQNEINERNQRFIDEQNKQQKINIDRINKAQGSKVTKKTLNLLPEIASSYLINNPYATEWPNGEPIKFLSESLIKTPKGLVKTEGQNGLRWEYNYEKYEDGGEVGLEMELTPEEIQDYLSRGYIIVEE